MKRKRVKVLQRKKHFSIVSEYERCFAFLKESRDFIYATVLLFFIFGVIGFFFQDILQLVFKSFFKIDLNGQLLEYLKNLILQTQGMDYPQLMGFIFLNNIQSSFLGLALGIFLGIFPLISLLFNGYILGFVAAISVKVGGVGVLWKILPHGIFELPAVFISLGLGIKLGSYLFIHKNKSSFREWLIDSLRVFLLIVFPLLVIAAIIETTLIIFVG
ncbi:MAG: stage II sporulation protein M [Nanoarchaeota archaeon]